MWMLLNLALAVEPVPAPAAAPAAATTASTVSLDLYAFRLAACEAVRAEVPDTRPADADRSQAVVIELHNDTDAPCTYRGIVLKGFLDGTYTSNRRDPDDGITIPPHDLVRLRVTPKDRLAARGTVQLQIPPEKGIVVLIGLTPE